MREDLYFLRLQILKKPDFATVYTKSLTCLGTDKNIFISWM